ncbi:MAG: antitoxin Xre/MbcA/ParS toxin-binding domain-containing protein [Planctomycetales bacterium]
MTSTIHRKAVRPKRKKNSKTTLSKKAARNSSSAQKPVAIKTLREQLNLNQAVFARLLPVSVRSLATLESGRPPTEVIARRLTELRRLTNSLTEVIKTESLGAWLNTPNQAFAGLKPLEVIDRGESDRIWSMIYFLRSGVPS